MSFITALLTPGGTKFYLLFRDMATTTKEMSRVFLQAAHEKDKHLLSAHLKQLAELQKSNELTTHKLFTELGRNFITPFDREDIHALASALNKIADFIWKLCKQMHTYDLKQPDRNMQVIADLHYKFIKILADTLVQLKNKRALNQLTGHCDEMSAIINKCDDLLDAAFSNLYARPGDIYTCIKRLDLFDNLQTLLDKSSDAINTIETMIIKYS